MVDLSHLRALELPRLHLPALVLALGLGVLQGRSRRVEGAARPGRLANPQNPSTGCVAA